MLCIKIKKGLKLIMFKIDIGTKFLIMVIEMSWLLNWIIIGKFDIDKIIITGEINVQTDHKCEKASHLKVYLSPKKTLTSQRVNRKAPHDRKRMRNIKTIIAVYIPLPIPISSSLAQKKIIIIRKSLIWIYFMSSKPKTIFVLLFW